jgi:hypothetical protein
MDIGIWWRIVFPVFHWQYHSVLFEIAWCIMLYLLVLVAEFGLTLARQFDWRRLVGALEKASIFLVILGISLSTLHQSSLGTLFLATPFRLHPLWHTDFLPLLFFISSMALGCLTISFLTIVVYWLFGGTPPMKAISGLGRLSAYLMLGYLAIKFIEIFAGGEGPLLTAPGWDTANFWLEILLGSAIPVFFLLQKRFRHSKSAIFWVGASAIIGMSLNRVNVAGLATVSITHSVYIPTWTEWVMTFGILAGAALFYLFCVEHCNLFENLGRERTLDWIAPGQFDHTDWKMLYFGGQRLGSFHLYSLVFILAAAISFGLMSNDAVFGVSPERTIVKRPRRVQVAKTARAPGATADFRIASNGQLTGPDHLHVTAFMIDGNRDGRYVLFDHDRHASRQGGDDSCAVCHHMNKPFDRSTGCYECHNDMYASVDIFDHDLHMNMTGGNDHCIDCHTDQRRLKIKENTRACGDCHQAMVVQAARIKPHGPRIESKTVGYMDAMHGLCINCHIEAQKTLSTPNDNFSRCTQCHQSLPALTEGVWDHLR